MTFSCIKFKRKFKMKFNMSNYSVEGPNLEEDEDCSESADVVRDDLKDSSRSYALSKSSTTTGSESSCNLDTSSGGQTSSSPNVTTNESFIITDKSLNPVPTASQVSKISLNKKQIGNLIKIFCQS